MCDGWRRPRLRSVSGNVIKVRALPLDNLWPPVWTSRGAWRFVTDAPDLLKLSWFRSVPFLFAFQFRFWGRRSNPAAGRRATWRFGSSLDKHHKCRAKRKLKESRWASRLTGRVPRPSPSWTPRKRSCLARTPRAPSMILPTSPFPAKPKLKAIPKASWTTRSDTFNGTGSPNKTRMYNC